MWIYILQQPYQMIFPTFIANYKLAEPKLKSLFVHINVLLLLNFIDLYVRLERCRQKIL
jgi:hypothetical protein